MTDLWVCSTCHSLNRQRVDRCYKCGAKQEQATGELAHLRTERAIQTRAVVRYRGSLLRGIIAAAFIVAVAVLGVIVLYESLDAARFLRDQIPEILQTGVLDEVELARRAAGAVVPALAQTVCAIAALLFFAAWLSRVVANIPALGGGTPNATPTQAFVYPLIPIWNLFKTPPMIQEALYRLDPKAGGFFMILLAWVGLVGSWIVSTVVGWWVNLRIASVAGNARTLGEAIDDIQAAYDVQVITDIVTTLMVSAGAIVLVVVMFRIEARARTRDREIRSAFDAGVGLGSLVAASPSGPVPTAAAPTAPPPSATDAAPIAPPRSVAPTAHFTAAVPRVPAATTPPASAAPPPVLMDAAPLPPAVVDAAALPPVLMDARPASAAPAVVDASSASASPAPPEPGPRLLVRVGDAGVQVGIDGDAWEPSSIDELREAAPTLRDAGGSAVLTAADDTATTAAALNEITSAFHRAGVPTAVSTPEP